MTRRVRHLAVLGLLLLTLPLLTANSSYRFTFSNPSFGSNRAEFVLEYFSTPDCSPCRAFEQHSLPELQSSMDAGSLRLVFRDLAVEGDWQEFGRRLFCLQEYDDYIPLRLAIKGSASFSWDALPALSGIKKARHSQCLEYSAADDVHWHNKHDYERRGLVGTPAFTLSRVSDAGITQSHWSGKTSIQRLQSEMHSLQQTPAPVASP